MRFFRAVFTRLDVPSKHLVSKHLSTAEAKAFEPLADLTAPFIAEMVGVLVNIARRGKREAMREKAASRVIELHLLGQGQHAGNSVTGGRVLVIQAEQLDRVEAVHAELVAEVK